MVYKQEMCRIMQLQLQFCCCSSWKSS